MRVTPSKKVGLGYENSNVSSHIFLLDWICQNRLTAFGKLIFRDGWAVPTFHFHTKIWFIGLSSLFFNQVVRRPLLLSLIWYYL
jgi:hypothetical protein